jgi:hypothetical protein
LAFTTLPWLRYDSIFFASSTSTTCWVSSLITFGSFSQLKKKKQLLMIAADLKKALCEKNLFIFLLSKPKVGKVQSHGNTEKIFFELVVIVTPLNILEGEIDEAYFIWIETVSGQWQLQAK